MVNRNDNMKYTIEDICDMNYERLKPDKLMISDRLEEMMSIKNSEQEFNNFINDYYLQVHNLMKVKENVFESCIIRDFRFRCVNILSDSEVEQIDRLLDNFDNNKLRNIYQKFISRYKKC